MPKYKDGDVMKYSMKKIQDAMDSIEGLLKKQGLEEYTDMVKQFALEVAETKVATLIDERDVEEGQPE